MTSPTMKLEYFYDALCGWCYASAPALEALVEAYPAELELLPSGLFSGGGARQMKTIADHAWRNDQRISELTGQEFTTTYRDNVLRKPDALFDSAYATRAIVAVSDIDPALGPKLLNALQKARYIYASDTSLAPAVATVVGKVCEAAGHTIDVNAFADRLVNDKALEAKTSEKVQDTQQRLATLPSGGVPQLRVTIGNHQEVVHGADLYGGAKKISAAVAAIATRAA